jgi:hypothetical protein
MLNRFSHKQKYFLLLAMLTVSAIAVYSLAIRQTISCIGEHKDLLQKMELLKDAPEQIAVIEMQLKEMEKLVAGKEPLDLEQTLLEQITGFSKKNNLTLIEFPRTNISTYQDYSIYINRIVLEGSFKNLLQFVHNAELERKTGKIASVQFKSSRDIRSKQTHLYAHIYFQNLQINTK